MGTPGAGDTSVFKVDGENGVFNIKSGGTLTTTSRFKTNSWSGTNVATVNVQNGATITASDF